MIRIQRVLCATDFSDHSERALAHAAALTAAYGARLTVQHVSVNRPVRDLQPTQLTEVERRRLELELRRLTASVPATVAVDVRVDEAGDAHGAILTLARELNADLLVVGSHGRSGFERLWLGSVTEKLLRKSPCPVLVVPRGDSASARPEHPGRVLCPVDFSEASIRALQYAAHVAEASGAELTVLNVIEVPPELHADPSRTGIDVDKVRAEAHAESLRQLHCWTRKYVRATVPVHALTREGAAYRAILQAASARAADLIVMGVHGRGAIDRFVFGSNTARVARGAACPVLVVRFD
jgi:nucleotide-binding universal stress UspA family protein